MEKEAHIYIEGSDMINIKATCKTVVTKNIAAVKGACIAELSGMNLKVVTALCTPLTLLIFYSTCPQN